MQLSSQEERKWHFLSVPWETHPVPRVIWESATPLACGCLPAPLGRSNEPLLAVWPSVCSSELPGPPSLRSSLLNLLRFAVSSPRFLQCIFETTLSLLPYFLLMPGSCLWLMGRLWCPKSVPNSSLALMSQGWKMEKFEPILQIRKLMLREVKTIIIGAQITGNRGSTPI